MAEMNEALSHDAVSFRPLYFKVIYKEEFWAEYAQEGFDLIFHFYNTSLPKRVWIETFPGVLDPVARSFFSAKYPRLKAAYTEEVDSWWLRANGCAAVPYPSGRAEKFIDEIDQTLSTTISK